MKESLVVIYCYEEVKWIEWNEMHSTENMNAVKSDAVVHKLIADSFQK